MRITERQLRRIIRESILFEGFENDKRWLTDKYPEHAQGLSDLKPKWIAWLTARFGESVRIKEDRPFEEALTVILDYSSKDGPSAALAAKYRSNEQFRSAVDSRFPMPRRWSNPSDINMMTVDEMKDILVFSNQKKQRIDIDEAGNVEGDKLGKIGQWNISMPSTVENSCKIAMDPTTGQSKVNWCTVNTASSNPFYKYVAGPDSSILFYLERDNPKGDETDFISLGFWRSKLYTSNAEGTITVDGKNMGMSISRIRSILGSDFDEIMKFLEEKVRSLSGLHPAVKKFEEAAKSVSALQHLLRGVAGKDAALLKKSIASQKYATEEVLIHLSSDKSEVVRRAVAENLNLPIEFLAKISSDVSEEARIGVANNKKITPDIARQLSSDTSLVVRYAIAENPATDSSTLARLASDENKVVRGGVAKNPKTRPEVLSKLINDKETSVIAAAAKNEKTPINDVINLSKSQDENIRSIALLRKNLPKDILIDLSKDPSSYVRAHAVRDEKLRKSRDWLSLFLNDEDQQIRYTANYYIKKLEKKNVKTESLLRSLIRRM